MYKQRRMQSSTLSSHTHMLIHAHTHAYIHTHGRLHTHVHTQTHTFHRSLSHAKTYSHIYAYRRKNIHKTRRIQSVHTIFHIPSMPTHPWAHPCTHTHTYIHTRIHTLTHTHTFTLSLLLSLSHTHIHSYLLTLGNKQPCIQHWEFKALVLTPWAHERHSMSARTHTYNTHQEISNHAYNIEIQCADTLLNERTNAHLPFKRQCKTYTHTRTHAPKYIHTLAHEHS